MPDVNTIPRASAIQTQLVLIETAIASIKGGNASVTYITITDAPPGVETRVIFEPPITNPTTLTNVETALQAQHDYLVNEIQGMGYTYTGSAIPSALLTGPVHALAPSVPPPPEPEALSEPPELPPALPPPSELKPPMDSGSPPPSPPVC